MKILTLLLLVFISNVAYGSLTRYDQFQGKFTQKSDGKEVIIPEPEERMAEMDTIRPKPGTYILDNPDVIDKRIESQGKKVVSRTSLMLYKACTVILVLSLLFGPKRK
jgi:hypothetical protein